jgi:methanogenic corrinoid protein MtbC1
MDATMVDALLDVTKKKIEALCETRLAEGADAYVILDELTRGLREIGRGYKDRYFDAELMVSGWNAKKAVQLLKPQLQAGTKRKRSLGRVVIGTVKGDVHDIGKDIVTIMLSSAGFEVIDLGIDVAKEQFAEAIKETGAGILALSALLTTTRGYMADVIEHCRGNGLAVKILVGGGAVNSTFAQKIGADAYGKDAVEAIRKAKELVHPASG